MTIKFPRCKYQVSLYSKDCYGDSTGHSYYREVFDSQEEVIDFLKLRSKNEDFHFEISLYGVFHSW